MNRLSYDKVETETDDYISYILIIHIEGEPEWRYVGKNNQRNFTTKETGDLILEFLKRNRYKFTKVKYSIRILTQIQATVTTIITENIFTSPYVKEKE